MTIQTDLVFGIVRNNSDLYLFVAFATLCSYSFHWWLTPPTTVSGDRMAWKRDNDWILLVFFVIGFTGSLVFAVRLRQYALEIIPAVIATFLYTAPKISYMRALSKYAVGKTIFLTFVWTYVTATLPILVSDKPFDTTAFLFSIGRFLLILAICILFDTRDREEDKRQGIRSMITRFDIPVIKSMYFAVTIASILSTSVLVILGLPPLTVLFLCLPALIMLFLFDYSQRNRSDFLYYGVLDGLMALSALFCLVMHIA